MPLQGNAALVYTLPSGQEVVHLLGAPLRDLRARHVQRRYVRQSLDYSATDVITVGSGAYELAGRIRYDDLPQGLLDALRHGANGVQLTYWPDLKGRESYAATVILPEDAIELSPDPDRRGYAEYQATILLRRAATFDPLWQRSDILFRYRGGESLERATFSRGSVAYTIDKSGKLVQAATHVPRIVWLDLDGDGVRETPVYRGEEGRTNAWTWSEALNNAAWTKAGASVSANVAVAPDGTSTADLLVESALNEEHYITRGAPTITNETLQTFSFSAKAGPGGRWVRIRTSNKAGLDISSYFDPSTGTFGTVNATHTLRVVDALPGGWYRVACTYNAGTGAGSGFARLNIATGNGGALVYTGDGASGLYLWGLQYEADQPFASTYMRTDASTFTRDPDTLYVDLPPGIAPESDFALYVRARKGFANNGGGLESGFFRSLWQIGAANGPTNPRTITIFNGSDVQLQQFAGNGSVSTASIALATPADSLVEAVAVYRRDRSGRLILSVGGGAPVGAERTAPSWSISDWAGRRLYFGSAGDSGGRSALDFASAVILRGPVTGTDAQILDECRRAA